MSYCDKLILVGFWGLFIVTVNDSLYFVHFSDVVTHLLSNDVMLGDP